MTGILPSFPIDVEGGPGLAVSRTRGGRVRVDIARTTFRTRGTGNTYLIDAAGKIDRLRDGLELIVQPDRTNDGPVFLSVDGLGTQAWRNTDGAEFGEAILRVGRFYRLFYDLEAGVWRTESAAASIADIRATRDQAREGLTNSSVLTPQTGRDLLEALLGSTSVKATGLATVKSVEDWMADSAVLSNGFLSVADRRFGARPDLEAAINTAAFQAAIDLQFARGGGIVWVPSGEWRLARTTATDSAYSIVTGPGGAHVGQMTPGPLPTALILRKGVTLMGQRGASKLSVSSDLAIASIIDGDGQGIVALKLAGFSPLGTTGSAAGVNLFVSADGMENKNLLFDDCEIYGFGGYGIAAQYGNMINNRYTRLYIHHTGADAIDHKARTVAGNQQLRTAGISFSHILLEAYGQRSNITASAGIDLRGYATLSHIHCRKFARVGANNLGLRFNAGLVSDPEFRQPSSYSTIENFLIEGDPLIPCMGVDVLSAHGIKVAHGNVLNCTLSGVKIENGSTPYGTSFGALVIGVTVDGSRSANAFETYAPNTLLIGCTSRGAYDEFNAKRGNLINGQMSFAAPRGYDPATVYVTRNGELEAGVVATNGTTFTLAAPAVSTDTIAVITPNAVGVFAGAANCSTLACLFEHTTLPEGGSSAGTPTYCGNNNKYRAAAAFRTLYSAGQLVHQVYSPDGLAEDQDYRVEALGAGGLEVRSRGTRAIRAVCPVSSVNWLQFAGSAAGAPVAISFQGADADGDVLISPKGSGLLRFGTYVGGAPAATGYISVKSAGGAVYKVLVGI